MTIRFSCPTCGAIHEAPDNRAGVKCACPKCGQKVRVPQPKPIISPTAQTVLGKLEDFPMPRNAQPPPLPALIPFIDVEPVVMSLPHQKQIVTCPGCGRRIPLDHDDPVRVIQCARCDTFFNPLSGQVVSPPMYGQIERNESIIHRRDGGGSIGLSVASLVLSIVAFPNLWIILFAPINLSLMRHWGLVPGLFIPGFICGGIAMLLGVISIGNPKGHRMAVSGLIVGLVSTSMWLVYYFWFMEIISAFTRR
jgi:hypothetical protein